MDEKIINEYYIIIKNKISQFNFESALDSINKLLLSFPNDSNAYYYKGVCKFALKKVDESTKAYLKAISLDIIHARAYFNLGVAYYIQNNYDNALINIAKALIVFSKQKELECKKRCIDALNFIKMERKKTS